MKIRSGRPRPGRRTIAAVVVAGGIICGAVAAPHLDGTRLADVANSSTLDATIDTANAQLHSAPDSSSAAVGSAADGASYQVACRTTGPDGSPWVEVTGPSVTGFLPVTGISNGSSIASQAPVCTLGASGAPATETMSCQQAAAAAEQGINQQANNDLFEQFMANYISNNAATWASTVSNASNGKVTTAPTAGSSVVNQAIQEFEGQDQSDVNSLASALKSVIEGGPAYSVFCVNDGEETPQQGENNALAYAAQDKNDLDPWLETAFDAIAQEAASLSEPSASS